MKGKCATCGQAAAFPEAEECTNCWEVERRLDMYLRDGGDKAAGFVALAVAASSEAAGQARIARGLRLLSERLVVEAEHLAQEELKSRYTGELGRQGEQGLAVLAELQAVKALLVKFTPSDEGPTVGVEG